MVTPEPALRRIVSQWCSLPCAEAETGARPAGSELAQCLHDPTAGSKYCIKYYGHVLRSPSCNFHTHLHRVS